MNHIAELLGDMSGWATTIPARPSPRPCCLSRIQISSSVWWRPDGMELISARKAFQRSMAEGKQWLNIVPDTHLYPEVTVA